MPRHVNVVLRKSELLDSFSVNHGASPYTDVTEQFASNENALEFSADDFINLHSNGTVGDPRQISAIAAVSMLRMPLTSSSLMYFKAKG
jgi:hypothetical protein